MTIDSSDPFDWHPRELLLAETVLLGPFLDDLCGVPVMLDISNPSSRTFSRSWSLS